MGAFNRIGLGRIASRRRRIRALLTTGTAASLAAVAGVGALAAGASSAAGPVAGTARTISLNENGHLHRTSSHGLKLNEQGSASGTIRGTMYVHLDVVSANRVTAEVNIYPSGGSLTASSSAHYEVDGGTAKFHGTMSIDRGSGSYSGAHGSGLSFSGTIQRLSGAVSVRLTGSMST